MSHATNSIDLPRQPSIRLFTNVGIDVFGQFLVKQGQSEVKQYGVVFTCLSVHAIHLKKLTCLDTDFFINAFVRYGSRRGYPKRSGVTMAPFETRLPKKVWSHNGTNLVNGHAELVRCLQQLDKDRTLRTARRHKVEFFLTHPRHPTMEGHGRGWFAQQGGCFDTAQHLSLQVWQCATHSILWSKKHHKWAPHH